MDADDMNKYQEKVGILFFDFCAEFYKQIGNKITFIQAYKGLNIASQPAFETFLKHLATFLSGYLKNYANLINTAASNNADFTRYLECALLWLIFLTEFPEQEIFKISIEWWDFSSNMVDENIYMPFIQQQ